MAQHKMKKKTSLPKGARQRSRKRIDQASQKSRGPRKGAMFKPPKKAAAVQEARVNAEVTKVINERNEELMKNRATQDMSKEPRNKKKP